ncbi:SCP2 sterol-binding domain-containing protein [Glaesserella parasuis]|uniref:ubiquinone biosynthesis accessory factor UbiJ n=1 Tax=Glaesserella parasuis TaxID=738 RepID=UPI0024364E98|nr:SCP2 sterol-binding domain-containing protein [Glaesserella parasuis]MDG6766610.1 SCP2 sterol-binding domain-containing protein [Glaesserella parasuis]MDO9779177.1 SCP2 sterol-binding domain-containing protein [Glaesserella parasuis]MDP0099012.1 SCP2 sterol-binding domain-containing protein [Glaesserella parasuis]
MKTLLQQLMLPQFALGALETAFNHLIERSPQTSPMLRKLAGKILKIQLNQPNIILFVIFSENRADWLANYEGEEDCAVSLDATALPKLADKSKLSELINNKTLILTGDIQVLQHFSQLLDELEKDPAELLSRFIGDVPAQASTDFAKGIFTKVKNQFVQDSQHLVDNLTIERSVLVHRLQVVDFCDQVKELEQQAVRLEQKFAKWGLN